MGAYVRKSECEVVMNIENFKTASVPETLEGKEELPREEKLKRFGAMLLKMFGKGFLFKVFLSMPAYSAAQNAPEVTPKHKEKMHTYAERIINKIPKHHEGDVFYFQGARTTVLFEDADGDRKFSPDEPMMILTDDPTFGKTPGEQRAKKVIGFDTTGVGGMFMELDTTVQEDGFKLYKTEDIEKVAHISDVQIEEPGTPVLLKPMSPEQQVEMLKKIIKEIK